ncbi:MAG: hypothetical protein WC054_12170 [Candidatus Nanopelagicales bacterium]
MLIRTVPDKEYLITEERIRFPVDATVPPNLVPFAVAGDLLKSIEILERHRGWHLLDRVPDRKRFPGKACCKLIDSKPGTALHPRFEVASFQGDTDDATNFQLLSNPDRRQFVDGLIDWVAILHFWEPAVFVIPDQLKEDSRALDKEEGFVSWDKMPSNAWSATRERFNNGD